MQQSITQFSGDLLEHPVSEIRSPQGAPARVRNLFGQYQDGQHPGRVVTVIGIYAYQKSTFTRDAQGRPILPGIEEARLEIRTAYTHNGISVISTYPEYLFSQRFTKIRPARAKRRTFREIILGMIGGRP